MDTKRHSFQVDDDMISYCGSMSGETFSSRRRRQHPSLKQQNIDNLAQSLRTDPELDYKQNYDQSSNNGYYFKERFNNSFHSFRFIIVMMGGFSLGLMLTLRYNVTVAILNMVNQTALYMEEHPNSTIEDFIEEGYSFGGEFNWDNEVQHMIMSWYMIAYTLPQMPCTKLGIKIGSRFATPISLMLCALSTLMIPVCSYWSWKWVILMRLINGIGASAVLPMMLHLIENWMPYNEISLGLTVAQMQQAIMTAANPLLAGYLSSIHWKYAFYVPGIATVVFCIMWVLLVSDGPEGSWIVSKKELDLICSCPKEDKPTKTVTNGNKTDKSTDVEKQKQKDASNSAQVDGKEHEQVHWTSILKLPVFYAYVFLWCFYCSSYSCFTFVLPTYLRQYLKIKVSENGIFCCLIQSGSLLAILWPHPLLNLLHNRWKLSMTASRRITYTIICSMTASSWILVGGFHQWQLALLFINRCFHGSNDIVATGCLMANFAPAGISSIAFSMVNTLGNLTIVFSSTFVGYVLDYTGQSDAGWSWIFYGFGLTQIIQWLTFSTLIDSNPVVFDKGDTGKGVNKSVELEQVAVDGTNIAKGQQSALSNSFDKVNTPKQA